MGVLKMAVTYDATTGLIHDAVSGAVVGYDTNFPSSPSPNSPIDPQPPSGPDPTGSGGQYINAVVWIASVSLFSANPNWPASPNGQTFNGVLVGDLRANGSRVTSPAGQTQTVDLSPYADTDRVQVNWSPRDIPNLGRLSS